MVSPVPKYLRSEAEHKTITRALRTHRVDLKVNRNLAVTIPKAGKHRAKYAPGLASALVAIAGTKSIGDPMAGTGMLAWETGIPMALNDIDISMNEFLEPLRERGCHITNSPADGIEWHREVCIFSPPYYPRTDRRRPNAHDDAKRGPVVGFRDSYSCSHPSFVGNPGGSGAIRLYRDQMTAIYDHLRQTVCSRMIVVTKNWTRLGTELRLDLDTILMAQSVGWKCTTRHGWRPPQSLWSRFNADRGGGVTIEDVLIFEHA